MKFVISTPEFNYLIARCQNIVSQNPSMPVLVNILIEAKGNTVTLTATDLTIAVRCFTEAKVLEEGSTTLPGKKLASLLRELSTGNVEVTTHENQVTELVCGTSKFKLNGMPASEFPDMPELEDATPFKIAQKTLKDAFYRTSFAVSRDDNRYHLTGLSMAISDGKATFIGTDGKRLARTHVNVDSSFSGNYILPLKAVEEVAKGLSDEGEATLFLSEKKVGIETDNSLTISNLLTGEYPDVSRVIPERSETMVSLHSDELASLLRQISLFTGESSSSAVKFTFIPGELRLDATTMEVGEGNVCMPANYQGQPMSIAFNPNFFLDILKHTRGETVSLGLTDPFNPGVITEEAQEEGGTTPLYVLMPMRISEDAS